MEFITDLIHFGYINKNGRIYQKSNIDLKSIGNKMIIGEMGFPPSFQVSLDNATHSITDLQIEDDVLYGKIKIFNTPQGKILKELVDNNLIAFRPRGSGLVNSDGTISDYNLYAFDAISKQLDPFNNKVILRKRKINKILDNIKNK